MLGKNTIWLEGTQKRQETAGTADDEDGTKRDVQNVVTIRSLSNKMDLESQESKTPKARKRAPQKNAKPNAIRLS